MTSQLDMFGIMEPEPKPAPYVPPVTRDFMTGAYGRDYVMKVREDEPDPIEIEVRGVPTLIAFGFGWSTYTLQKPGSLYWSETGFRSFATFQCAPSDEDKFREAIERYIDGPTKDGNGCGGKLKRWWPTYILQWRQSLAFELECGRENIWTQWGPEKHKECWDNHDKKLAEALERMKSEGIDPDLVGPPNHFKGKWPTMAQASMF